MAGIAQSSARRQEAEKRRGSGSDKRQKTKSKTLLFGRHITLIITLATVTCVLSPSLLIILEVKMPQSPRIPLHSTKGAEVAPASDRRGALES